MLHPTHDYSDALKLKKGSRGQNKGEAKYSGCSVKEALTPRGSLLQRRKYRSAPKSECLLKWCILSPGPLACLARVLVLRVVVWTLR